MNKEYFLGVFLTSSNIGSSFFVRLLGLLHGVRALSDLDPTRSPSYAVETTRRTWEVTGAFCGMETDALEAEGSAGFARLHANNSFSVGGAFLIGVDLPDHVIVDSVSR